MRPDRIDDTHDQIPMLPASPRQLTYSSASMSDRTQHSAVRLSSTSPRNKESVGETSPSMKDFTTGKHPPLTGCKTTKISSRSTSKQRIIEPIKLIWKSSSKDNMVQVSRHHRRMKPRLLIKVSKKPELPCKVAWQQRTPIWKVNGKIRQRPLSLGWRKCIIL